MIFQTFWILILLIISGKIPATGGSVQDREGMAPALKFSQRICWMGHPVKIEDFPGLSPRPTAFLRKQEEGQREKFKRDRMKLKNKDKPLRSQSRQARSKYLFVVYPPQADLSLFSGALIEEGGFYISRHYNYPLVPFPDTSGFTGRPSRVVTLVRQRFVAESVGFIPLLRDSTATFVCQFPPIKNH